MHGAFAAAPGQIKSNLQFFPLPCLVKVFSLPWKSIPFWMGIAGERAAMNSFRELG
jgi:hypothetical protein